MPLDIISYLMGKASGGGGGGGGTIVSKTITENGTYRASTDNADGYNPVIVNVSGGPFEEWDFTGADPLIGKLRGLTLTQKNITFDSSGANFLTTTSRLSVPVWAQFAVEIDVASMSLSGGTNRRFIMGETQEGLVYRSTGNWGFYTYSGWEMFSEASGSLFSGSTVRIEIDTANKWHIYKDGVLLYEPSASLTVESFHLGSTDAGSAMNNAVISAMRLY